MAISVEAEDYFRDSPEERDYALKVDESFDINFRGVHEGLSFWFANPKRSTKERFGLQKEVLFIFSQHMTTDMRVMRVIEYVVNNNNFRHRIDRILFILIYKGNREDTINLFAAQPDKIIIPIHIEDLNNPNRGSMFMRSCIAQTIGKFDLFGMTSPITSDDYFFGRNELVQSLVMRSAARRENSGLFGLRKTGKTSVLRSIQRWLSERLIITEYVDCSNPGIHTARWWNVLENFSTRCAESLKKSIKREVRLDKPYTQDDAGMKFLADMKLLLSLGKLDQIILMLDEIEYITHGLSGAIARHWDDDFILFWQTIRSVHQETQGQFIFIVAGVNPVCVEKSHFGITPNPIFQLAAPHYLEPFTIQGVRDMVRSIGRYAGLEFDETVYQYLQNTYGGHPFLIRVACSEIWKMSDIVDPHKKATVHIESFHRLAHDIKQRLTSPIKDILLSLVWWYPEEYELLQILADGDAHFVSEYLKDQPDSMIQFAKYGVLRTDGSGKFAINDLREFIKHNGEKYKKDLYPFTRGDIPPEMLPQIPDLNVLGELFIKRSDIEIKLRTIIMLYLGVKANWDGWKIANLIATSLPKRSDRKEPKDLFMGRPPQEVMKELYTTDLKAIVCGNWDAFATLFDSNKARFEMNMDTLNIARRADAHTKPITHDEKIEFENSYTWLSTRLSKVPTQ